MIDRQITQIPRLADDLMDATRAGQGALRIHKTCVDLIDVLADPFEAAAMAAAQRGQTLTLQVPDRALRIDGRSGPSRAGHPQPPAQPMKFTPKDGCIAVDVLVDRISRHGQICRHRLLRWRGRWRLNLADERAHYRTNRFAPRSMIVFRGDGGSRDVRSSRHQPFDERPFLSSKAVRK
jgi:hypothetical protein